MTDTHKRSAAALAHLQSHIASGKKLVLAVSPRIFINVGDLFDTFFWDDGSALPSRTWVTIHQPTRVVRAASFEEFFRNAPFHWLQFWDDGPGDRVFYELESD